MLEDRLNSSMDPDEIAATLGSNVGSLSVLIQLRYAPGVNDELWYLLTQTLDKKRLYDSNLFEVFKNVCDRNFGRFIYHVLAELPNQETGEIEPPVGRYAIVDPKALNAFMEARCFGQPGAYWALRNPPGPGYEYPITP